MANILGHLQLWQRSVAYDSSPHFPVALHLSRSYPRTTNEIREKLIMSSTKWFPRDPRRGDGEFDLWGWMLPSHIFTLLAPPFILFLSFRLATGLRRIWSAPKQNIKKKNKSNQKKKKYRFVSNHGYYIVTVLPSPMRMQVRLRSSVMLYTNFVSLTAFLQRATAVKLAACFHPPTPDSPSHTYMLALHLIEVFIITATIPQYSAQSHDLFTGGKGEGTVQLLRADQ